MDKGPLGGPRPLGMGPLAKPQNNGSLTWKTAFAVTDAYGQRLEDEGFRSREEEKIQQLLARHTGLTRKKAESTDVTLSPAGNLAGIRIAVPSRELLSHESRQGMSVDDMTRVVEEAVERVNGITGFRVPGAYGPPMGEMTDEPMWAVECR